MTAVASDSVVDAGITLEHVFDYVVSLKPPVVVGSVPGGTRLYYEAVSGEVSGPRLSGEVLSGGGDWALVGDDGWTQVDVRGQTRTDDGAVLYMTYTGVIEPTPAFLSAYAGGGETAYDDQYWRVAITVETGDDRYAWLTRSVLVGRGRLAGRQRVAYSVYRVG